MVRPRLSTARRIDFGLLLLAAIVLAALALWVYWPYIERYAAERMDEYSARQMERKPVRELIEDLSSVTSTTRFRAMNAILNRRDPAAVPILIEQIDHDDPLVRSVIVSALGRIGSGAAAALPELIEACSDESGQVRAAAAFAIALVGSPSKEVRALWVRLLGDGDSSVVNAAQRALMGTGDSGIAAVTAGLAHERAEIRSAAAGYLDGLGPKAVSSLEALVKTLEDPEPTVRVRVVAAIASIGREATATVPALIMALGDSEEGVAVAAAAALQQVGDESPEVFASLSRAASRPEEPVRVQAIQSLYTLNADTLSVFTSALDDTNALIRGTACRALAEFGPNAGSAVDKLVFLLKDEDASVRGAAAWALGGIRSGGDVAIPALMEALQDNLIVGTAARALGEFGAEAEQSLPTLLEMVRLSRSTHFAAQAVRRISPAIAEELAAELIGALDDASIDKRRAAATALNGLKPADRSVLLSLVPIVRKHKELRYDLVPLLGALGPYAEDVVPTLLEFLEPPDTPVRYVVLRVFADIGAAARAAEPVLLAKLQFYQQGSAPTHEEGEIARTLGRIAAPSARISDALRQSCERALTLAESPESLRMRMTQTHESSTVACQSIWALAELGGSRELSVPVFERAIRSPDTSIRMSGALALGRIGSESDDSVRCLCDALLDPQPAVRIAAAVALGQLGPAARSALAPLRDVLDREAEIAPRLRARRYFYVPEGAAQFDRITVREAIYQAIQQIDPCAGRVAN